MTKANDDNYGNDSGNGKLAMAIAMAMEIAMAMAMTISMVVTMAMAMKMAMAIAMAMAMTMTVVMTVAMEMAMAMTITTITYQINDKSSLAFEEGFDERPAGQCLLKRTTKYSYLMPIKKKFPKGLRISCVIGGYAIIAGVL